MSTGVPDASAPAVDQPVLVSEYRGAAFRTPGGSSLTLFSLACACLTGTLLWLSYFPVAWGGLAWVALAPVLLLVRLRGRAWRAYAAAWLAGLLFYWPALQWMRVADWRMYFTWAGLATYCSLYFPLAIALIRRLDGRTRLPLVVTVPVVWTALEYLRAHFGSGFPWYFLGYSQHRFLAVIQIADLGGVYAVTFVVAALNALLAEFLADEPRLRRFFPVRDRAQRGGLRWLPGQWAFALALLAGTGAYGVWRLGTEDFTPGPRVALLQGNLDQRLRNAASSAESERLADRAAQEMVSHFRALSDRAASASPKPDILVWPETSFPGEW